MSTNPLPVLYSQFGGAVGTPQEATAQVKYGITKTITCRTNVATFMNGHEQRFVEQIPLHSFSVPLSSLLDEDRDKWIGVVGGRFLKMQGRFAQDISLTINGVTYSNLTCLTDSLAITNARTRQYDIHLSFRQVTNYPYTVPTMPITTYPNLQFGTGADSGYSSEMPLVQTSTYLTTVTDNEYGPRYGLAYYGTALFTNFPTSFLSSWKISYPLLDDADADTLENFFLACQGRYSPFIYVDPINGGTFTEVRFDSDELVRKYTAKNQNSMEISLRQTF